MGTEAVPDSRFPSGTSVAHQTSVGSFSRTFANRDLFAGPALLAVVWSVLAAFFLAGLLISGGLLLSLLIDRGALRVRLSNDELPRFEAVTGYKLLPMDDARPVELPPRDAAPADGEPTAEPEPEAAAPVAAPAAAAERSLRIVEDEGLIGPVWRVRDRWYGPALSRIYRRFELLRLNTSALTVLLLAAVACWLLRQWCLRRIFRHSQVAAQRVAVMFRKNLHRQALRLSPEDIDEHSAQSAIGLFTTQVDVIRHDLAEWIARLARYPLEMLCVFFIAWNVDYNLTIQWVIPLLLCWGLWERATGRIAQARRIAEDRARLELHGLSEQLLNARLVRGFGMEQTEHDDFLKRIDHMVAAPKNPTPTEREAWWLERFTPLVWMVIVLFLGWLLGLKLMNRGESPTIAGALVFVACIVMLLSAARRLWELRVVREKIAVAADQIYRFLDRLPSVSQAVGAKFLQPLTRSLHFDAVTFRTPTQGTLLDRVTLKLEARKSYAVVSLDPLGAKAFALLLPRFLEPQSGRVLFDGEDIAWATLESLRAEAVFVGGDDPPLRGSVLDNLRAGNGQLTISQATEAAKETHAHNFIMRLSQGYETVLTGSDDELDASQRFRLALARAILHNPALLIIEEPSATLDEDTKQLLDDTYQRISANRTVIFLPSRLSTLKRVDEILLLQHGQIVAQGPQTELVSVSPLYRHWEYLHFNEFRRADAAPAKN